ncbi:MAG: succinyldiaminopimelate transaminase [Pseudonocardia sp.]
MRFVLPDFPWDSLASDKTVAAAHPDGIVDLSIGTPVDPVPDVVRAALGGPAAGEPGYPTTHGTPALRVAVVGALTRRFGVTADPADVLPTIGSKELVAWLPTMLGLGPGDLVVLPELAYPTYEIGARLAGADWLRGDMVDADVLAAVGPRRVGLVWVNSPSNPTGRILPAAHLRRVVAWAREHGAMVASDECYLSLGDGGDGCAAGVPRGAVSILHPEVCGGSHEGLLAVHSMSKSSNLAGYRAGFAVGDPAVIAALLEVRKHAGMIMPGPVQAAMAAAASDDAHTVAQARVYARRRAQLRVALEVAGLRVEHSEAGLYLWATAGEGSRSTVRRLATHGVLVAPGEFYGPAGARHVRVAVTASDERIAAAVRRLAPRASRQANGPQTRRAPI